MQKVELKKYDQYKDSGVKWLGEIPEHWKIVRSKRLFYQRKERSRPEDTQLTASQKYGIIPQKKFMELEGRKVTQVEFNNEILKHVEIDDFVISMRSFQGGIEYSNYSGCVSSAYISLVPIKHVVSDFFKYLLKSDSYIKALSSTSNLVRDGQALRFDNFNQIDLIIVPDGEQTSIANFLDEKCGKIDQAIAQNQKLIKLLKDRKQILIQNAVTKGLDPKVKMKDSGVEWIGEIPEHWDVTSVKYLLSIPITDGPHTTPNLLDDGIPFISAEAIKNNKIDFTKKRGFISQTDHELFCIKYKPKCHDIYMVKSGATTGNIAIVETEDEFSIWSPLAVFRTNKERVQPKFMFQLLQSSYFKRGVELSWSFGTQQNIGMGVLSNLPVAFCGLLEQQTIVNHIETQSIKIDKAIALQQQQIEKLKEYKASLINSAVTGKIKVC